jgi:uncharacterized protein (DUF1499 family)
MTPSSKKRMIYIIIIIAVVLLLPVIFLAVQSALAKRPDKLGVQNGRLADCPKSPNCVSTQATDAQHQIEPIPFDGAAADAIRRIKAALATLPGTKIITEKEDYLHAEATSLIFRFVDDVEFFVDKGAKKIHFRSASRAGYSDLGVNRSRMEKFRTAFMETR